MNPAALPTPVDDPVGDRRWMDMHERFVGLAQAVKTDVLFLGDSITWYMGDTEAWDVYFKPLGALNFGIGGDSTQHLLWRIQNGELEPLNPQVIVLLIGTNNITLRHTAEQVSEGILTIVQYITKHKPHSKILLLGVLPRGQHLNPARESILRINQTLRMASSEFPSVHYHDVGSMFVSADGTISCEDMLDYIHLTRHAYSKLCRVLHEFITQLLK